MRISEYLYIDLGITPKLPFKMQAIRHGNIIVKVFSFIIIYGHFGSHVIRGGHYSKTNTQQRTHVFQYVFTAYINTAKYIDDFRMMEIISMLCRWQIILFSAGSNEGLRTVHYSARFSHKYKKWNDEQLMSLRSIRTAQLMAVSVTAFFFRTGSPAFLLYRLVTKYG